MADENTPLTIEIDVETEKAKKKLAEFNKALKKAANQGEQAELLQGFQEKLDRSLRYGRGLKGTALDTYTKDVEKLQTAIDKLLHSTKLVNEVQDKYNENLAKEKNNLPEDFTDKQLKTFDKRVWNENKGTITEWTNTTQKGVKSVVKELKDADGQTENIITTLTKAKGTFIESGKVIGDIFSAKGDKDRVIYKTAELGNGLKTIREYAQFANGELYLTSEAITQLTEKEKKLKGTFVESGELLGTVFSTKDYGDKTVTKTEELGDGFKTVREYVKLANGELYLLSQTLTKIKEKQEKIVKEKPHAGTLIGDGKILGTEILRTDEADKTKIKTEEIANGFKKVRDYVKLANGELYLMSTRTTKVEEETTKLTKKQKIANFFKEGLGDLGKNASKQTKEFGKIFGRMGSIITYRIVRSMLSAITNAFKQGFSLLGSQNTAVSAIQEQFTAITTSLQVSLTTILIPLFQTLSTVLAPLSQTFIDIANAISYTNAKANEQSTYFQLSKEKIDEYAKSLQKTNKQLSQLDKFATLSGGGSSTPILGEMVEVSEASDKVIKDTEKYQKVIDFFDKVNGVIEKVFKGAEKLFNFVSENFELVIGLAYGLLTALNPLASAIVSLGVLMSDASPAVKVLAGTMLALSGALLAVGIAKEFTKNPYAGIAAAVIGGGIATGIAAMVGSMSSVESAIASSGSSLNFSTTGYSSGSDLYSGIESATKNGYTSSGATRVSGDVYIDGIKAGKVLENSVYNEGVRVGHMGRK